MHVAIPSMSIFSIYVSPSATLEARAAGYGAVGEAIAAVGRATGVFVGGDWNEPPLQPEMGDYPLRASRMSISYPVEADGRPLRRGVEEINGLIGRRCRRTSSHASKGGGGPADHHLIKWAVGKGGRCGAGKSTTRTADYAKMPDDVNEQDWTSNIESEEDNPYTHEGYGNYDN